MHSLKITINDEIDCPTFQIICTGTPDAPCRRRPPDWKDRESWTDEEATEIGHDCLLIDWVEGSDYQTSVEKELTATIPITYEWDGDMGPIIQPAPPEPTTALI